MTRDSHHRRFGPVMWGAIGITFMALAVVAVYGLDPRIADYAVGALVLVCLALCGVAFWLDARATRTTERLVDQLCRRSTHTTSKARPGPRLPARPDRDLQPH